MSVAVGGKADGVGRSASGGGGGGGGLGRGAGVGGCFAGGVLRGDCSLLIANCSFLIALQMKSVAAMGRSPKAYSLLNAPNPINIPSKGGE